MMRELRASIEEISSVQVSARPIALFRIGIVALLWNRYGAMNGMFGADSDAELFLSLMFFGTTALVLVGFKTRLAAAFLFATLAMQYYVFGYGLGVHEYTHHHAYMLMLSTLIIAMGPSDRAYSIDRWLAIRAAENAGKPIPDEMGPGWAFRLMTVQMAALYFWAAVDKTSVFYLSGDWLARVFEWGYAGHILYPLLTLKLFLIPASIIVLIVEYYLAAAVLCRLWLPVTCTIGIALHLCFALMLNVDTYSLTMILGYLAVIPADRIHAAIDRLQGYRPAGAPA